MNALKSIIKVLIQRYSFRQTSQIFIARHRFNLLHWVRLQWRNSSNHFVLSRTSSFF